MKSIAIISQHFYPSHASTAQLLTDLARGLGESGYAIEVFTSTPATHKASNLASNITTIRAHSPLQQGHSIFSKALSSVFFLLGGLWYVLFRIPSDTPLLIASNPPYAGVLGICFKLLRGGQYTFLFQDIFPESAALSDVLNPQSVLYRFFDQLMVLICQQAESTILLTPAMQAYLEKKNPALAKRTNLQVIENWAIEAIEPLPKADNPFACQNNLDNIFTVLYSGNIGRLHDIATIAEAIRLLKDEPIQFVFIGDGPKQPLLAEYIEKYRLQNLRLLPFQPREQLSFSLTACDLSLVSLIPGAEKIVAPCKFYGMLAAGRAIVSISEPGSYIAQRLSQHDCGINCPPGASDHLAQTIKQLANQPERVARFSTNAHQLYKAHYQVERAIQEYEKLLC